MKSEILNLQTRAAGEERPATGQSTIFEELLRGNLPAKEKSAERLAQEGALVVSAGTETTAWGPKQ